MKKSKITAFLILLLITMALSGCISTEEEKKTPKIEIELIGGSHKIYAGNSTTYILIVKNNREENDTVILTLDEVPSGWEANLNLTNITLTKKTSFGIFLLVNASQNAKSGEYKVKVKAVSDIDGAKHTKTITTKVIKEEGDMAVEGDKVEVDYIGYLLDYTIFDTSIEDIGNDPTIQKTPEFEFNRIYDKLKVYVGSPDADDTDDYILTVEGFWEAIIGMKEGQSRTVFLPPSKAYGLYENATVNVTEKVAMTEIMSVSDFSSNYPNEKPTVGLYTTHHFWGWNITIFDVDEDEKTVTIINGPDLDQKIEPYGWESEVIYKNQSDNDGEGLILVEHNAQSGMKAEYLGYDAEVKSVEEDKIHLKYNVSPHNLGTKILIFDITLDKIAE